MKFLDDSGLTYLWQKVKGLLGGKVDKEAGKGLSTNDYDNNAKNKVDKLVINGTGENYLADDGTYKPAGGTVTDVKVNGTSVLVGKVANIDLSEYAEIDVVDDALSEIDTRITSLEGLGQYVGTFDTYSDLAGKTVLDFDHITINDHVNIRYDENYEDLTTRYIARDIDFESGLITWTYDITYSTDISGKMDLIDSPTANNILIMNSAGQATDGGKKLSELVLKADLVTITNEEIDEIMEG